MKEKKQKRESKGDSDNGDVVVETIHAGFRIARKADLNTYAPPGRLRRYDPQCRGQGLLLLGGLEGLQAPLQVLQQGVRVSDPVRPALHEHPPAKADH